MCHRLCFSPDSTVFVSSQSQRKLITLRPDPLKDVLLLGWHSLSLQLVSLSCLRVLVAPLWVKYSKPVLNEGICLFLLESLHYMCMFSRLKGSLSQVTREGFSQLSPLRLRFMP